MGKSLRWYGLGIIVVILFFGTNTALPDAYAGASGTSDITVHTLDSSGEIFGYFTVLSQGASGLATDFTATTFTLNNGETYNVGVQDFGDMKFDYWQDTGFQIANRDILATANADLFAVYRNIMDPSPSPDTPKLIVRTVNSSGEEMTGYWTTLLQGGVGLQTGFSPEAFIVNSGESYEILMGNFGGMSFDHWADGSTDNPRTYSITSDETYTAYYMEENICTITVVTENSSGEEIAGYWTVFYQDGTRLQTGFSPDTFDVACGETYEVKVRGFDDMLFDHWEDGNTNDRRTFSVNSDTTFTAFMQP